MIKFFLMIIKYHFSSEKQYFSVVLLPCQACAEIIKVKSVKAQTFTKIHAQNSNCDKNRTTAQDISVDRTHNMRQFELNKQKNDSEVYSAMEKKLRRVEGTD